MNGIAHVFDCAVSSDNQRLAEIGIYAFPFRVDADELQFVPAAIDDFFDVEIELARHDDGVRLAGQFVQELERDAVDFVVHI